MGLKRQYNHGRLSVDKGQFYIYRNAEWKDYSVCCSQGYPVFAHVHRTHRPAVYIGMILYCASLHEIRLELWTRLRFRDDRYFKLCVIMISINIFYSFQAKSKVVVEKMTLIIIRRTGTNCRVFFERARRHIIMSRYALSFRLVLGHDT